MAEVFVPVDFIRVHCESVGNWYRKWILKWEM